MVKQQKKHTPIKRNIGVSRTFVVALSLVSIMGFLSIISESFFSINTNLYVDSLLMFTIGIALIAEANTKNLKTLQRSLDSDNISTLITIIIGSLAVASGVMSFPSINIQHPSFIAMKGILSVIAIIIIIIQTWVVEKRGISPLRKH